MCFSASASFTASAVLIGVGSLAWRAARRPAELPFAAIPLLFAIQQFIEGVLWLTFSHEAALLNGAMTRAYTFFSHVLWPVFIPLAVLLIEPGRWRRRALMYCVVIGALVSSVLLILLLTEGIVSRQSGRHIEYVSKPILAVETTALYLLSTGAAMLLSTHRAVKAFGQLALLSFVAAYLVYTTWFISVWCYFSAVLSAMVLVQLTAKAAPRARAGA